MLVSIIRFDNIPQKKKLYVSNTWYGQTVLLKNQNVLCLPSQHDRAIYRGKRKVNHIDDTVCVLNQPT